MIKEGVLQDVEAIFSVHTDATTSTGNISSDSKDFYRCWMHPREGLVFVVWTCINIWL